MIHFKVVLVGSSNSGKTSIIQRYINNQFTSNLCPTVQAGYFEKSLSFDSKEISLDIWDTAGQERFHSIAPIYYRDAAAGMARRRAALLGRLGRIQAAAREERPPPRRGAPQKRYERAVAHRGRRMHALRAQARP